MELRIASMQKLNPELEEIRNRVLQESSRNNNNKWIKELIQRTSKIHAGFLFEDRKTLQDLCLFVGGTQNKISDPGWEALGHHLGLNPCVLKVINYNNFNKEDPMFNLLLAFVQFENATIGKIVQALLDIGRLDVISRIRNNLNDLVDIVLQHRNNHNLSNSSESSDYGSLQMNNERNNTSSNSSNSDSSENRNTDSFEGIVRPFVIPPAPFIFQNIQATPELTSQQIEQSLNRNPCSSNSDNDYAIIRENYLSRENNKAQCTVNVNIPRENFTDTRKPVRKRYGKILMLTFATDGEKYVQDICKILRRERDCYPRIGVLVLGEHASLVMKDPHRFITTSFHQADYICPILTDSYFKLINRKENVGYLSDEHLDARYAQFIYAMMNNYYVSNGCLNDKIRCIIPDEMLSAAKSNLIMRVPIFSAWVKLSEVEELAVRLLKSRV